MKAPWFFWTLFSEMPAYITSSHTLCIILLPTGYSLLHSLTQSFTVVSACCRMRIELAIALHHDDCEKIIQTSVKTFLKKMKGSSPERP